MQDLTTTEAASPGPNAAAFEATGDVANPADMTVTEIKRWLTDRNHEAEVWHLTQKKAKKAEYVKLMQSIL